MTSVLLCSLPDWQEALCEAGRMECVPVSAAAVRSAVFALSSFAWAI